MLNIKNYSNFRDADNNYFYFVFTYSIRKQISPFIYIKGDNVKALFYLSELLEQAEDDDLILQAWPVEGRTDVVAFRMKELKLYKTKIKSN
jgi:hypothetical protein